jgi:hypothetical protein
VRIRRGAAAALLALVVAAGAVALKADVAATPSWRLSGSVSTALLAGNTVYLGGAFTQLFTPSSSQDQFYDPVTAQARTQCARSTHDSRSLGGVPDGRGGLLVVTRSGDEFADSNGPFAPPGGTTIVRIADDCLWDRTFAAPGIDPAAPGDLTIGTPVPVAGRILAAHSIIGPDGFQRAQVAEFDAVNGTRIAFQFYPGVAEIGFFGPGPNQAVARVRGVFDADYQLGSVAPGTLALTTSATVLTDESAGARTWVRGATMFRSRPAPSNLLEAYDLAALTARSGWTPPAVPTLVDVDVAGPRVFLAAATVNGQAVAQPAALLLASGAVDGGWTPPILAKRTPDPSGTPYVPALTQIATDGVRLYFSGDFERVGGTDRDGVAAIALASAGLDPWNPAPLIVQPLESTAGGLLMTRPTGANRVTRRYLAAVDRSTGVVTPWNPNDSGRVLLHAVSPVSALAIDGGHLYFASATTGELLRASLATADVDQDWRVFVRGSSGQPGIVTTMVVRAGVLYLGGEFATISGTSIVATPRRALAAVGVDGVLRSWAPALDGPEDATLIRALLPLGGTIYLGGDFTTVNSQFRLGFGAVDAVTGEIVQPELYVLGGTRIHGLATDGTQVFVAGVSFGAPLVGAASIPGSELTTYGPTGGVVPSSAAFVAGRLYAGLEYDVEAGAPTARTTPWSQVVADDTGLLNITPADALVEFYAGVPGNPPGAPSLSSSVSGNTVVLSWTPGAGGAASSYTVLAGSAPGASDLAALVVRGATSLTVNAPNGRYFVTVVARNSFGAGPPSNEVVVQVGAPPCTVPPTAPGPLSHTIAGLVVSLAWGGSPTAAAYILDAGSSPGTSNIGSFPLTSATSVVVSAPPGVYYVRVRAASACGVSPPSNERVVTVTGNVPLPEVPTGLTATVVGNAVSIAWTPPTSGGTPSGYQLEAGYAPGAANAAVVQTTSPGLVAPGVPAATYYVRVRALNAAGLGPATADVVVTVP